MVAYQLLRLDVIAEPTWRQLTNRFREEWLASRRREEDEGNGESAGPSYYVLTVLGSAMRCSIQSGAHSARDSSPTKAAQVLGVNARNVDPLLHGTLAEQGRR